MRRIDPDEAAPATPGTWQLDTGVSSNRGLIGVRVAIDLPAADGMNELQRATEAMERLRTAKLREELRGSVGGPLAIVLYRFRAHDAFGMLTEGRRRIAIENRAYTQPDQSAPWTSRPWPGPFTWPKDYYREFWRPAAVVRRVGVEEVDGVSSNIVAFVTPELPAWFRLWVGVADGLVRRQEMLAEGHLMDHSYSGFDEPLDIRPPI